MFFENKSTAESQNTIKTLHVQAIQDIPKFGIRSGEVITEWSVLHSICIAAQKEGNSKSDSDPHGGACEIGSFASYWRRRWRLSAPAVEPSPACKCNCT